MEILPLGPCLVTDTAGLDDEGELGAQRIEQTLKVLDKTDVAVWVGDGLDAWRDHFRVPVIEYHRGDSVEGLKAKIAALKLEPDPALLEGLVNPGDHVTLVCPIDESAPKGRLILPQVQVLRECLDRHAVTRVVQLEEFEDDGSLTIVDSQTFGRVKAKNLTSFSILFARQKGDLDEFNLGLAAVRALKDGDTVLIAEACTHHRQCNDIGATKIPKALAKLTGGKKLNLTFASGPSLSIQQSNNQTIKQYSLVLHCGGCMLTRRMMLSRIEQCRAAGIPIVNYGLLLQAAANEK